MAEILATVGTAVGAVAKVNEYVLTPIMNQFSYVCFYNSNIQSLRDEIEKLNKKRGNVELEVDPARKNAETIGLDVEEWLANVIDLNREKDKIIEDATQVEHGCFFGWCPNIKLRYSLSRKAKKVTKEASMKLQEVGNFGKISYPAILEPIPAEASAYAESISRKAKKDEIMKSLRDDKVYVTAVCGTGGIGKTTMVKEIENKVRETKMFEEVAMVVVSRPLNLFNIQQGIAEGLGLKLDEKTEPARAKRLHKRLKDAKSVLVILDDIWEKFNLREIGIPSKSSSSGCKIILTCRDLSVVRKIENDAKIIELDFLSEQEAWIIFKEKAGDEMIEENRHLYPIAMDVVKECKGLPLALVTVAGALKNSSIHSWKDALQQLKLSIAIDKGGAFEEIYVPLRWSYDQLPSEEARYLFLFCCLFPEDCEIPLEDLVRYVFGLHIFKGVENLASARDRVYRLVEILKDRFLLIGCPWGFEKDFTQVDRVKMHDIIRDMAVSISSQDEYGFMAIHDKNLREWPKRDSYENYTCISLSGSCNIVVPENINCPRLQLLFVEGVEMRERSLGGMKLGLKVLITRGVESLPSPLPLMLRNLRSLFLQWGTFWELPNEIGELVNLEILDLAFSAIAILQKEMGNLKNLKLLDVTRCKRLQTVEPGVISGLVQLEELLMWSSFNHWEASGNNNNNPSFSEVASLTNLTRLQIEIPRLDSINFSQDTLNWEKLASFNIEIGNAFYKWYIPRDRCILLEIEEPIPLSDSVQLLIDKAQVIELSGKHSGKIIADKVSEGGFQDVKIFQIGRFENLEVLFDVSSSTTRPNTAFLPRATILRINGTNKAFKDVCRGQPPPYGSFSNLGEIYISGCEGLKNLFTFSIAAMLSNLESLTIRECDNLEIVFLEQNGDQISNNKIAFPKLSTITLWKLPRLAAFCKANHDRVSFEFPKLNRVTIFNCQSQKSLCTHRESRQNLQQQFLFNQKVICDGLKKLECTGLESGIFDPKFPISGLERLKIESCNLSVSLFPNYILRGFVNIKEMYVFECHMLREVISKEEEEITINSSEVITLFPQLEKMSLQSLPLLEQFWHVNHDVELPLLLVLNINGCEKMTTFSSRSPTLFHSNITTSFFDGVTFSKIKELNLRNVKAQKRLFNHKNSPGNFNELEDLKLVRCSMLEEVFSEDTTKILFPKLKNLELQDLPQVIRFHHILPSVEKIKISGCDKLKSVSLPLSKSLETLKLIDCPMLEEVISGEDETLFPQLKELELWNLPKLTIFYHFKHYTELPSLESRHIFSCPLFD